MTLFFILSRYIVGMNELDLQLVFDWSCEGWMESRDNNVNNNQAKKEPAKQKTWLLRHKDKPIKLGTLRLVTL